MDTKRILLDERIEMKVAVNPLAESVIYCRPFEEDMHNVSAFTIHGQEFVHTYSVGDNNEKYITSDVITEDGDVYEDVKFKLVVINEGLLPMSTVNLNPQISSVTSPTESSIPINESALDNVFLALSHEQKVYLEKYIDERIENIITKKLSSHT